MLWPGVDTVMTFAGRVRLIQAGRVLSVCLLLACMFDARAAFAQSATDETGFQPNRDYLALQPFESIDTASGNVVLTFTDLVLPGNAGRDLRIGRVFSNLSMDSGTLQWRLSISGVPLQVVDQAIPSNIQIVDDIAHNRQWSPSFKMPDGSLQRTTFMQVPNAAIPSTLRWVSTPGFWKYDREARLLYMPDGLVGQYDAEGRLRTLWDPFGNTTTLTPVPGQLTIEQSLGNGESREVVLTMDDAAAMPTRMTYDGRVWIYNYRPDRPGRLTSVQPPVGPSWQFDYEAPAAFISNVLQVTTPQGGRISYAYAWQEFSTGPNPEEDKEFVYVLKTRTVDGRDLRAGTWNFDYLFDLGSGNLAGTEVTLPSKHKVTFAYLPISYHMLAGNWSLFDRQVHAEDGTLLEWEHRDYHLLRAARPNIEWFTPELSQRTITRAGRTYTTEYVYDLADTATLHNYHRPVQINESGAPGELARSTGFTYLHLTGVSPFLVALPTSETVAVGNDAFARSWAYNNTTGFRVAESSYGITTTFTPDAFGNVATATKANGHTTAFGYSRGQVTQTSTPGVLVTRTINADGTVASETTAGRTTSYEYDALSRVTVKRPPWSTNAITTEYDNASGASVTTRRGGSLVTTRLDGFGRPIHTENSVGVQTSTAYDAEGRKTYQSYPFVGTGDLGTTFTYDALGRVTSETNPDGSVRSREYVGNAVTVRDEENRATVLTRLAFGHPDDVRLTGVLDAALSQWNYEYNALGSLTRVAGPDGIERRWTYDTHNLLTTEQHPESGTVTYAYDAAGVLTQKTDARGTVFTYGHDGNDRVTRVVATPVGAVARETTIGYEPGSDNRESASLGAVDSQFFYDDAGRLFARNDTIDGAAYTRRFEYDANDNPIHVTYPSGRRVTYAYDSENRLARVTDTTGARDVATDFAYHPSGAITSYRSGDGLTNTIAFDAQRYWPTFIGAGALQLTYGNYDRVGNVRLIGDPRAGDQTFSYDSLYRLATANGAYGSITYTYDGHGNRTGPDYEYWPGTLRLKRQNVQQFGYDDNGNLTTAPPSVSYTYTPENMLETAVAGAATTTYTYDADQWRVRKADAVSTSYFLRGANGELLTESRNPGTSSAEARDYIYAGSRLLSVVTSGGSVVSACTATLSPTSTSVDAGPASGTVTVSIQAGCAWTATSPVSWLSVTLDQSGSGPGTVRYSIAANPDANGRSAVLTIARRSFSVTQAGAVGGPSGDRLLPGHRLLPDQSLTSANGQFHFKYWASGVLSLSGPTQERWRNGVAAGPGYAEMRSDGNFVVYDPGGHVAWDTHERTQGHPNAFLVVQDDGNVVIYAEGGAPALWWPEGVGACTDTIAPRSRALDHVGGTDGVSVTAPVGCPWTATSPVSWVHITSGQSGSGNGVVTYSVDANPAGNRTTELTIATQAFTVTQGGQGSVASDRLLPGGRLYPDQWLTSANGQFQLKLFASGVLSLSGPTDERWRSGVVAGRGYAEMQLDGNFVVRDPGGNAVWDTHTQGHPNAFLVVQDDGNLVIYPAGGGAPGLWWPPGVGACTYATSPRSRALDHAGVTDSITVTAPVGCPWTATSPVGWISLGSGQSGSGDGVVMYSVAGNPDGANRAAALTIAGQAFTVTQGGQGSVGSDRLLPGQQLFPDQYLTSANGQYHFGQFSSGVLSLWGPAGERWRNGVAAGSGHAVMQFDGNFVEYGPGGNYEWDTHTYDYPGAYLVVQDDGNVVVYDTGGNARWSTGTAEPPPCTFAIWPPSTSVGSGGIGGTASVSTQGACAWTATSSTSWVTLVSGASGSGSGTMVFWVSANASTSSRVAVITVADQSFRVTQAGASVANRLQPGQRLYPDQSVFSPNGLFQLRYQGDGNLVLYGPSGSVWSINHQRPGYADHAEMQADGNFVVYDSDGAVPFDTETQTHNGAYLTVEDDGDVSVWAPDGSYVLRPLY